MITFFVNSKTQTQKKKLNKYDVAWFDIDDDWDIILISIAKEYHLFIDEMSEEEGNDIYIKTFLRLIQGLGGSETLFGYIVSIRSEEDYKIRKKFTEEEKLIWLEWQKRVPIEYKQAKMQEKLDKLG